MRHGLALVRVALTHPLFLSNASTLGGLRERARRAAALHSCRWLQGGAAHTNSKHPNGGLNVISIPSQANMHTDVCRSEEHFNNLMLTFAQIYNEANKNTNVC